MINYDTETGILALPDAVTIYQVKALKEALMKLTFDKEIVYFDLKNTTEIDTSGIQLLIAFSQHLLKNDHMMTCINLQEDIFKSITALNPLLPINAGAA